MYTVLDLETETNEFHGRKASPFSPENWVVMRGWKHQGEDRCSWTYHPTHDKTTYLKIPAETTMLVGFNIKFDLLHEIMQGNPDLLPFFKRGGKVWDCQYAEYLIMAQQEAAQMCSLDSCAPKYGGKVKIDEVKLMWEAGIKTSAIQEQLLEDYLVGTVAEGRNGGDIRNTELVFLGQIALAKEQGQLTMIEDRMDGLLCTTYMEHAGLKVDIKEAARRLGELEIEKENASAELNSYLPADLPFEFNWGSGTHTSCFIYGGTVKYDARSEYLNEDGTEARLKAFQVWPLKDGEPVDPETSYFNDDEYDKYLSGKKKGEIKTKRVEVQGERKTKIMPFLYEFERITAPEQSWKLATTDGIGNPLYSTAKDQIVELSLRNIPFLKSLALNQRLEKEIGTYYIKTDKKGARKGMLTAVQTSDHVLHHNLNHSLTVTTRLSSSNPNLQNVPRKPSQVKRMFVSRFPNGQMLEIDYSQLEVVVQGMLSGDPALCKDLRDKIDFHCKRVAAKKGITYEEAVEWCKNEDGPDYANGKIERTKCKIFSFQRAYGAGAATIADETGMGLEEVQELMASEDLMYPGVVMFNSMVEKAVKESAVPFQAMSDAGFWKTYRRGFWQAPTGTIYSFRSYDAPDFLKKKGILDSFSPPDLKNYPVQGTGGEVVQAMLGRLFRRFVETGFYGGKALLVNTVHDCVWFDCDPSVLDQVAADAIRIMESIPQHYKERYGIDMSVPFPVEAEVGLNMFDLKHWKPAV